jgi:hypothetical protein
MVDDRVRIDLYACPMATLDHLDEFLACAAAAGQLITYGLIALIPGPTQQQAMLVGRRYLHGEISLRSQKILTFLGDIIPRPFKQMDEDSGFGRGCPE